MWQDSIRDGEFVLTNPNRLVRFYDGCNGLKTGSTDRAGFCVSASAKRGNMQLIAVILGAPTRDSRNNDARALLDYGFASYALYEKQPTDIENVRIKKGTKDSVAVYSEDFCAVVKRSDLKKVEEHYEIPKTINAPVGENEKVGSISFSIGEKTIGTAGVCAKEAVEKASYIGVFIKFLENILR